MAYWNSGSVFNRRGNEHGFTWNSKYYLFVVRLNDTMQAIDNLSETLARLVLAEQPLLAMETLVNSAFYGHLVDDFSFEEDTKVSLLFALAEELGVKDELSDYIVSLFLEEKWSALEKIKLVASLLTDDDFNFEEKTFMQAFYYLADKYKLSDDKITYFTELFLSDKFNLLDHEPREAVSDWLIGAIDTEDRSFDYLIPFGIKTPERNVNMRVDWKQSELAIMPEASNVSISLPNVDGDLIQSTTYKDRLFSLVLYSEDNLTTIQKEDLKRRITQVLSSTKEKSQKLTVQARGITFDARYQNSQFHDGPSYLKCNLDILIPPYGVDMFPNELRNSGLINNSEGMAPLSPKFTITGSVSNPYFTLGGTTYRYNGTVPSGKKLVADFEKYSVYLVDNFGSKQNVLKNWIGDFQSIPAGSSEALVIGNNLSGRFLAEWKVALLW